MRRTFTSRLLGVISPSCQVNALGVHHQLGARVSSYCAGPLPLCCEAKRTKVDIIELDDLLKQLSVDETPPPAAVKKSSAPDTNAGRSNSGSRNAPSGQQKSSPSRREGDSQRRDSDRNRRRDGSTIGGNKKSGGTHQHHQSPKFDGQKQAPSKPTTAPASTPNVVVQDAKSDVGGALASDLDTLLTDLSQKNVYELRSMVEDATAEAAQVTQRLQKEQVELDRLKREQVAAVPLMQKSDNVRAAPTASADGTLPLSRSESLSGAQVFNPISDTAPDPKRLVTKGHVAMASIVGELVTAVEVLRDGGNGPFAKLELKVETPQFGEGEKDMFSIRCYGESFTSFCTANLARGDVIHVVGQLTWVAAQQPAILVTEGGGALSLIYGRAPKTTGEKGPSSAPASGEAPTNSNSKRNTGSGGVKEEHM